MLKPNIQNTEYVNYGRCRHTYYNIIYIIILSYWLDSFCGRRNRVENKQINESR